MHREMPLGRACQCARVGLAVATKSHREQQLEIVACTKWSGNEKRSQNRNFPTVGDARFGPRFGPRFVVWGPAPKRLALSLHFGGRLRCPRAGRQLSRVL